MTDLHDVEMYDLDGEDLILGGSSRAALPATTGLARPEERATDMVTCRESNQFDTVLMQGMIEQTLSYCKHLPSTEQAMALGIRPLKERGSCAGLNVAELKKGAASAVLFEIAGVYHFYSMSSAAKMNDDGENNFSEMLVDVLQTLRPRTLHVASLARLVRSFDHGSLVQHAVTKHVDVVRAGTTVLEMSGENAAQGQIMWATLSLVAASERISIVQRLTAGLVAKHRRGEWIFGVNSQPLGFRLDSSTKKLVWDPDQRDLLVTAFTLMADPSLLPRQIVKRLADAGVTTRRTLKWHGDGATIADLGNPQSYLQHLLRFAPLYEHGRIVTAHQNPFPGIKELAGMPVHYDRSEQGELRFEYEIPGVSIDPALVRAAVAARGDGRRRTGGAARERIPALNQLAWTQDDREYWIRGAHNDTYELRVRAAVEK
jgi:DNA invertase Pin-like site-specific DNA recombinase